MRTALFVAFSDLCGPGEGGGAGEAMMIGGTAMMIELPETLGRTTRQHLWTVKHTYIETNTNSGGQKTCRNILFLT
jgi:hypothetical protein